LSNRIYPQFGRKKTAEETATQVYGPGKFFVSDKRLIAARIAIAGGACV
jgi:hypothetical protein